MGLVLYFVFSRIDYRLYINLSKILFLISFVLLSLTLVVGFESRGSIRWIQIGAFRLQFSEILKPFLITVIAAILIDKKNNLIQYFKVLLLVSIPIFLIFKQPDLGSALAYLIGFFVMIFASQTPFVYLIGTVLMGLVSLPILWRFLADYQKKRFTSFINPTLDPLGASYNAIQAVIAVGSGMFFGRGLGRGTQSHLLFLPEHHTDFVFASVAEEFGFFGAALVLTVYFILIWQIFKLAINSKDRYGSLILVGIGSIMLAQVLINVGMNLGLFPVTGITLPLISYGGSSVLATMIALGIVQNIASLSKQDDSHIIGT